jgi:hypothetical protein
VALCASNPFATQADVALALSAETEVHAGGPDEWADGVASVVARAPRITLDDGADLLGALHMARPELLDAMLGHWRRGRKVVLATRETRNDPGLTALLADLFYAAFRRFAIATMPRRGFDFFLIDRRVCDLIAQFPEANTYLMGLILWVGFEPAVVAYHRRGREARFGRSMWNLSRKLKYFADAFVAFSYAPVRIASVMGASLGLAGLAYAVVVVLERLFRDKVVEGWSSLMVVLLVASGAQLMMTGVLGEYLWRNLEQARGRPRYIIDRVLEPCGPGASESRDGRDSPARAA